MRLAHVSDPHLNSGPTGATSAAALDLALRRIAALDPRPDAVVVTGDLAHRGRPEEYAILRELLAGFPIPTQLAIGNHDDRDRFLEVFGGSPYVAGGSTTHHRVDYPDGCVIVLDSKDEASAAGRLDDQQLEWLGRQLGDRDDVPAFVCLHHPPVPVGIPALDVIRLADPDRLASVLAGARTPARVLVGHVHRAITATFAGTVVSVAPSTFRQVDLDLRSDQPLAFVHEPAGFLLHVITGGSVVSHLVPIADTSARYGTLG